MRFSILLRACSSFSAQSGSMRHGFGFVGRLAVRRLLVGIAACRGEQLRERCARDQRPPFHPRRRPVPGSVPCAELPRPADVSAAGLPAGGRGRHCCGRSLRKCRVPLRLLLLALPVVPLRLPGLRPVAGGICRRGVRCRISGRRNLCRLCSSRCGCRGFRVAGGNCRRTRCRLPGRCRSRRRCGARRAGGEGREGDIPRKMSGESFFFWPSPAIFIRPSSTSNRWLDDCRIFPSSSVRHGDRTEQELDTRRRPPASGIVPAACRSFRSAAAFRGASAISRSRMWRFRPAMKVWPEKPFDSTAVEGDERLGVVARAAASPSRRNRCRSRAR